MKKPSHIDISVAGNSYRIRVPDAVRMCDLEPFREYHILKKKLQIAPVTYTGEKGRVWKLPLPVSKYESLSRGLKPKQKEELEALQSQAVALKIQLTALSNKFRNKKSEKRVISERQKLFEEYSDKIFDLLGKGYTPSEVHKRLYEEGVDVSYKEIIEFHNRNRVKVAELRTAFNEEIGDVSIYNKRSRLEKLNYLLNELMTDFERSASPNVRKDLTKEIRGIIEQARKEVEGEELKLTVNGRIDIDATLAVAAASSGILEGLTVAQIVISRVAARQGLNSQFFIDKLANSYYSKFNGFRRNDDLKTRPIYPTAIAYDITDIGMREKNEAWNKKQQAYEIPIVEAEKAEPSDQKKEMRAKLMALLERSRKKED